MNFCHLQITLFGGIPEENLFRPHFGVTPNLPSRSLTPAASELNHCVESILTNERNTWNPPHWNALVTQRRVWWKGHLLYGWISRIAILIGHPRVLAWKVPPLCLKSNCRQIDSLFRGCISVTWHLSFIFLDPMFQFKEKIFPWFPFLVIFIRSISRVAMAYSCSWIFLMA